MFKYLIWKKRILLTVLVGNIDIEQTGNIYAKFGI